MSLTPGTRLGPYEILSALGAGGMGEVYRATDTKLKRQVAIKILPPSLAADRDRLARFQREAEVLASLNHPNIAAIYGLEESEGVIALVMELVEGDDLSQRIARGAVPLDESLPIAKQIAEALEAAHEQGIIHRDLKPANINVRSDGTAKVLDFGLAKLTQAPGSGLQAPGELSQSPTLTSPAMTQAGMILGTAAYMSPEQAKGRPADKRSDLWAFGCVLFEMATGRRAFDGEDAASVIAGGVIVGTTAWYATRPADPVPPRVSRLLIAPSGTAALTLSGNDPALAITPDGSRVIYVGNRGTQIFVRALDALEPVAVFTGGPHGLFVSPDGQWIGFIDGAAGLKKVAVTGGPPVTLAILDGSFRGATWGPEDTIIVATNNGTTGLQRVAAAGGPVTVLTRADRTQGELDHLWPELLPGGRAVLFTITAQTGGLDAAQVAVLDLQTGTRKILVRGGTHAHYVPNGLGSPTRAEREGGLASPTQGEVGHLVYVAAGTLRAVAFDLARLEPRGTSLPVVPDVVTTNTGDVYAVVAGDGTLAYVSGAGGVAGAGALRTLVWVDRQGHESPIPAPPRAYIFPRLSPDGTRIALFANDQKRDIWVWDLGRTTLTPVTFDPTIDSYPVWTPDGGRLIFSSDRAGARDLFRQAADGTGAVEQLTDSPNAKNATAVSPDGARLIFTETAPKTGEDVMQVELDGTRRVTPLVQSPFTERNGIISPDGRWLAYEANDSGPFEIHVRPFPAVNSGHWQVSTDGGNRPLWARSGQELFFLSPTGELMRVGVERSATWTATMPTKVLGPSYFSGAGYVGRTYDVSRDGQRFLRIKEGGGPDQTAVSSQIIVVQHWVEELKHLVAAGK